MSNIKKAIKNSKVIAEFKLKENSLTVDDQLKMLVVVSDSSNTLVILEVNNRECTLPMEAIETERGEL